MLEESAEKTGGAKKKKSKLALASASDSGRRLVEYFCVISSVERQEKDGETESVDSVNVSFSEWKTESYDEDEESVFSEHKFRPKVTARYPLTDHADDPLHEQIMFFCHPTGGIQLRLEELMPKVSCESVYNVKCVVHAPKCSLGRV